MIFSIFSRRKVRQLSDEELLAEVRSGNQFALGEIFQRYSPLVMGLCLKYMKDKAEAEDQLMMLFEGLSEKIKKSDIGNFKNWLYSVTRNNCLMALRKRKIDTTDLEKSVLYLENDAEMKLSEKLEKEEELTSLENAINELKDEQQVCIKMFYLKQLSYDQISEKTAYPLKKVKSYIQNGKRNLKIILENRG